MASRPRPGYLHAPGSLVAYEPQVNSDVFGMFQSEVERRIVDWGLLTKDVRPEFSHDLDYLISMLDWDANVNPEFAKSNKTKPRPVKALEEEDEVFVTTGAAKEGVVIENLSISDPLAMLKHFGPGNPDAQLLVKV